MPNNQITLDEAAKMTSLYQNEKENILAPAYKGKNILCTSETFDRSAFDALLAEDDCVAVRIYYGMSDILQVHAIAVGVNSKNEDILPAAGRSVTSTDPVIIEDGIRCPDECPTPSALNP